MRERDESNPTGERRRWRGALALPTGAPGALAVLLIAAASLARGTRAAGDGCEFTNVVNLGPGVNTRFREQGPDISSDGLTIFFNSDRPDGFGSMDLYQATLGPDGFGQVMNLGEGVNTAAFEFSPSISGDGLSLYFSVNRAEGFGMGDIYVATRANSSELFGNVQNLGGCFGVQNLDDCVNTEGRDSAADVTADGLMLVFSSDRPGGGHGFRDIYMATREKTDEPFGNVRNLAEINLPSVGEFGPSISADGLTLYFNRDPPGEPGGHDIYRATRGDREELFGDLCWLGGGINTGFNETGASISADRKTLYFGSDRRGGSGDQDLWAASPSVPEILFLRGDCNDDGSVNISDATCILNWLFAGEATPDCIAAINTNGGENTNITDATYLLNHLFAGGPAPVAPFPDCGPGTLPTDAELGCAHPPNCQ